MTNQLNEAAAALHAARCSRAAADTRVQIARADLDKAIADQMQAVRSQGDALEAYEKALRLDNAMLEQRLRDLILSQLEAQGGAA